MAHIFSHPIAGFSLVADTAKAGLVANTNYLPTGGRFGGGAFACEQSTQSVVKSFPAAGGSRVIVQFSIKMVELGFDTKICELRNRVGGDLCLDVRVTTRGQLEFFTSTGIFIARTPSGTVLWNTWHSIAIEAEIGNDVGALKVYADGVLYVNVDGFDLNDGNTGGCDEVRWILSPGGSRLWHLCQIFIYDDSGPVPWNAFIGDKQIYTLLPTSDNAVAWTRSAGGVNSDLVDDPLAAASDEDGTFVLATTDTLDDFYEFENLPAELLESIAGIISVLLNVEAKDDGSSPGDFGVILQDAAESNQVSFDDIVTTTDYLETLRLFEEVPGAVPWTVDEVNGMTGGPHMETP